MEQLLAKLTNLGYEFFGVVLPGVITALFLISWWAALGSLPSFCSFGLVPDLSPQNASRIVGFLKELSEVFVGVTIIGGSGLAIVYFLGHIVLWISRSEKSDDQAIKIAWRRICSSLVFRIPKPEKSYDANLQSLFEAVQGRFVTGSVVLDWRKFYPVVKSYLSNKRFQINFSS